MQIKLKKQIEQLSVMYEVSRNLVSIFDLKHILDLITERAAKVMNADICSLRLLDRHRKNLILKSSYGLPDDIGNAWKKLKVGNSIAGRVVESGKPAIITNLAKEKFYKDPHFAKRFELAFLISVPLIQRGEIIGVLSLYSSQRHQYTQEDMQVLYLFASQAAVAIENARLFRHVQNNYMDTIKVLSNIIDAKDRFTHGHSERVMKVARKVASELGLKRIEKRDVSFASFLHDLGKISIDGCILRKADKLTDKEWEQIRLHPSIGADIVKQIRELKHLAPIILHHHARFEGGGYPDPVLKNNKIPIGSRILGVVDSYEAMVSDRPYRKALPEETAIAEICRCSGTQFDPQVVEAFLKVLKKRKG